MLRNALAAPSIVLALLAAAPAPCAEEPAPAPAPAPGQLLDRVVAIVNDGIVTKSELDSETVLSAEQLRQRNVTLPPADTLRRLVLDRLVLQEIQQQRAERIGIQITDEQLNASLTEIAQRNGVEFSQLPSALAAQGIDYAGYRDTVRKELTLGALRQREVISRLSITPRELDQFIERVRKLPGEQDEYNFSHILIAIPPEATQAQVDELAKRAEEVHARAATEDFARLALAYSESPTALEGGMIGWRKGPELPTALAEVIVALKPGEVSKPLATPTGFHIVRLNEVRSAIGNPIQDQVHARHILMTPNELQDDATVRLRLAGIRERVLAGEDFGVFASSLSEDSGSAVDGGDLGWAGPGSYVPEFEQALASLSENEISPPFRTQFGWHIVQLLGRRQFDITEDALRQRAFRQLQESKVDEETELWLRRLRDESFVEINL